MANISKYTQEGKMEQIKIETLDDLKRAVAQAEHEGWTGLEISPKPYLQEEWQELAECDQPQAVFVIEAVPFEWMDELVHLTALQVLAIHDCELHALPPEIGQLTDLRELDLCCNRLSALPPEIGQLTNLRTLYLINNELSTLPSEIGRLTSLSYLNLCNNQLSALPPEIGRLTSLNSFDLDNNRLSTLPPEIGQLTSLQTLYFNNKRITPPQIDQQTDQQEPNIDDTKYHSESEPSFFKRVLTALKNLVSFSR